MFYHVIAAHGPAYQREKGRGKSRAVVRILSPSSVATSICSIHSQWLLSSELFVFTIYLN
jgi:hypothetical protein